MAKSSLLAILLALGLTACDGDNSSGPAGGHDTVLPPQTEAPPSVGDIQGKIPAETPPSAGTVGQ